MVLTAGISPLCLWLLLLRWGIRDDDAPVLRRSVRICGLSCGFTCERRTHDRRRQGDVERDEARVAPLRVRELVVVIHGFAALGLLWAGVFLAWAAGGLFRL